MMNEQVKKILENNLWEAATVCSKGFPNVVPVGFKAVLDDGKLAIGDVFLKQTLENIEANHRIAISAFDPKTTEGYQVKGRADYVTDGPVVEKFKALAEELFHGACMAKGAVIITPKKIVVTTPGPDNKKVLPLE